MTEPFGFETYPASDDRYSATSFPVFAGEEEPSVPPEDVQETLRCDARAEAAAWKLSGHRARCRVLGAKARDAQKRISSALDRWARNPKDAAANPAAVWLIENARLLRTAVDEARQSAETTKNLPQVEASGEGTARMPRSYLVAAAFLRAADYVFSEESLVVYARAAQEHVTFEIGEIWALKTMMQLALLEAIGRAAQSEHPEHDEIARPITSLRRIGEADWKELFEELSETETILRQDPARAYARMDFESRELYRGALQELAARSELDEPSIARRALELASANYNAWSANPRVQERRGHIGYYLVDHGRRYLERQINFHASFGQQIRNAVLESPEVFYFVGIELLTLGIIAFALSGVRSDVSLALAVLFFLLPATESGIGIMNQLVSALIPARPLPKLDFSAGISAHCATMVTIPTLLIEERQVRQLVADLETRYFGNRDPNLHFALLTDSPDSPEPSSGKDRLVELCSELIRDLNDRHASEGYGGFFLFHRRHLYNASEGAWMGWERKRGKLVDFNNLLRGKFDSFPVKVGDVSVLPGIQYVLTLDSDTQLPRDSAHRLIGTLAHPLNRAVISPSKNTVIEGYGVLQPRVGISVRSASRSRLASIYSGQTGFDIYTRAVSDVYQDLFREGIFTGKGIYEVDVFQQVLGERFPSNAILSHDLIEGAYARAGLVTDTEVIDDYPSHFSAYSRRKHRWVRGDWQILRWLLPRVPTYSGKMVPNPLGVVSRWKILDNLRRSLIELATFVLLLAAWFFLPGSPGHWTVAILVLMLLPSYAQLLLALPRVFISENPWAYLQEVAGTFVTAQINVLLWFIFLAHQTLVTLDAVVRTLVRLTVTHRNLLEWETAAEAETASKKKTPVDLYMDWMPAVAIGLGVALALYRPHALRDALPFFALWGLSKPLSRWLDHPLVSARRGISARDRAFLREAALRTWRFFRSFACEDDHGFVPDNVQETPPAVAHRISPTNLGLLLDARLAAYELGFLTLPEFLAATRQTFSTAERLRRFQGHFFNWYDTQTLEPLAPLFVSTVDSGNLAACLWTLKQGCLKAIHQPLVRAELCRGVREHWNLAIDSARAQVLRQDLMNAMESVRLRMNLLGDNARAWFGYLPVLEAEIAAFDETLARDGAPRLRDAAWWIAETRLKMRHLRQLGEASAPWLLPEFAGLLDRLAAPPGSSGLPGADLTLELLPRAVADLDSRLDQVSRNESLDPPSAAAVERLRRSLHGCVAEADRWREGLETLAEDCDRLVSEMDFRFLYQPRRKVLSVGYDVSRQHLEESCYELLASEARTAAFVAIAKGDVPQQSWLHLGRSHTLCQRNRVLLSWTGTLFEYLMPALWMRTSPRTILDQSMRAAVVSQRKAFERTGLPWGISEAACSETNQEGHYQYRAFGLPELALRPSLPENIVVSSYSGFLALLVDPASATDDLRLMRDMGWIGSLGFYESAEVINSAPISGPARGALTLELVRCWMAHHQGMILLSLANVLADSYIQCLFHAEPQVTATERLLHERVPAAIAVERNDRAARKLAVRHWLPTLRPAKIA